MSVDAVKHLVELLKQHRQLRELDMHSIEPSHEADVPSRFVEVLSRYYSDADVGLERAQAEKAFWFHANDPLDASTLVSSLSALVPEVDTIHLEKIGEHGPLIVRMGERQVAVEELFDEGDTDEVDLEEIKEGNSTDLSTFHDVTLLSLVSAVNTLLAKLSIRERFVALRSDGISEGYLRIPLTSALELCQADCLEQQSVEELMNFAGW